MTNDNLNPHHVQWCKTLFNSIRDGGAWGVPRSGLIFNKRGNALVLVARMPHVPEMSITVVQLLEQQTSDYAETKRHFEAAGFEVRDET